MKLTKPDGLVSGLSTSADWETVSSNIAVMAMGSCEQHGAHMPLLTDSLLADSYAEYLALELEAAQLPTMPIGTSMEHAGFRGSVSFRPETYMAMIRDLADDLEVQGFTRLILVNGHGGNFSLGPVVRDINRSDRAIKIIVFLYATYDSSEIGKELKDGELHAGACETSRLLALYPELVGELAEPCRDGEIHEAIQTDLNMHGFAVFRPTGVWGNPHKASVEAGKEIEASIKANMLADVKAKLKRFDDFPAYSGK